MDYSTEVQGQWTTVLGCRDSGLQYWGAGTVDYSTAVQGQVSQGWGELPTFLKSACSSRMEYGNWSMDSSSYDSGRCICEHNM